MPPKPPMLPLPAPAQALMDAGLQHAVLMRAMPVLRHDLASPLSVMRMGTLLLKRRLARGDMTPEQAVERVEQLEQQLGDIAHHIRRLRQWDLQISERLEVRALVAEAIDLARPMLMVRGTELIPLADGAPGWDSEATAQHTLLYGLLAAIYHLAERPGPIPARITVEPGAAGGVCVRSHGVSASQDPPPMQGSSLAQPPAMDLAALHQLAQSLGLAVQVSGDRVDITLQAS